MSDNVVRLPNGVIPIVEPVSQIVEMLEKALAKAKDGRISALALVEVEPNPSAAFNTDYFAKSGSRHSLAAGSLSLAWSIGRVLTDDDFDNGKTDGPAA